MAPFTRPRCARRSTGAMWPGRRPSSAWCEATGNALGLAQRALVAHLFSVLPKIGLDEEQVPLSLLNDLAKRAARAGALVEVNEKWSCPSARTALALASAGVHLVAGSDSHHCRDIAVYDSVRQIMSAAASGPGALPGEPGAAPRSADAVSPAAGAPPRA